MCAWLFRVLAVELCISVWVAAAESPLDATRSALEKWVETRQLISRTKTDWQSDREMLRQTAQMFERELNGIAEQFSKLSTNNVQAEKERQEAEALLKASEAGLERTAMFATAFEKSVTRLVPRLPAPLQETLKPLLARLPADPANTRLPAAERIQTLVGILNEIDKFNNGLTLSSEKRRNPKGEEVAVETVYVGLGAAYFVNDANDFAGTGTPGPQGWEWSVKPELAGAIRDVIRSYRNEQAARFVALPATIR